MQGEDLTLELGSVSLIAGKLAPKLLGGWYRRVIGSTSFLIHGFLICIPSIPSPRALARV